MKLARFLTLTAVLSFSLSALPRLSARTAGVDDRTAAFDAVAPFSRADAPVMPQRGGISMVAVLRRDGTIIPFANWNGRKWSSSWPAAAATIDVPITLESVPRGWWPDGRPQTSWTAWPIGGTPQTINVKAPLAIGQHCDMNVGLATDYRSAEPAPPPQVQPYPKDGVATTGGLKVEQVEIVSKDSPLRTELQREAQRALGEAEDRFFDSTVVFRSTLRAAWEIEVVARTSAPRQAGASIFYLEAVRRHPFGLADSRGRQDRPQGTSQPCRAFTIAQGFAFRSAAGKWSFDVDAYVAPCGRGEMVYGLPLGEMRVGDRLYWLMQVSGWGYERYEVLDMQLGSIKRALSVFAGSC
ncbi:MAG: hypothetical protein ACE148_03450 [Vicinamibacterales bacterium]